MLRDFDGLFFVNYLDKLETGVNCEMYKKQEHLYNIKKIMDNMDISIISIKSKYLWLKEKYEERLKILNDS